MTDATGDLVKIPGVDPQVIAAAQELDFSGKTNPAWAFIDQDANHMCFGRWPKPARNHAPYVRLDLILAREKALKDALRAAKDALEQAKLEWWREAVGTWAGADFLTWPVAQKMTAAIRGADAALKGGAR